MYFFKPNCSSASSSNSYSKSSNAKDLLISSGCAITTGSGDLGLDSFGDLFLLFSDLSPFDLLSFLSATFDLDRFFLSEEIPSDF
jgi:hypothetical protein